MIAQRFVETNPQFLHPAGGYRTPQQARALPRRTAEPTVSTRHNSGDHETGPVTASNHYAVSSLPLRRMLWHPGFGVLEYPRAPDRTINYYRNPVRKHDISQVKTLQSNVTVRDIQMWEDVVISEVWLGGNGRLSMLAEFFDTLHMFRITEPDIGRSMGWIPKDLSFHRHMIQPIALQVGSTDVDLLEARERVSTSLDSYIDQQVVFSFKLVRPEPLIDSLLVAEGI